MWVIRVVLDVSQRTDIPGYIQTCGIFVETDEWKCSVTFRRDIPGSQIGNHCVVDNIEVVRFSDGDPMGGIYAYKISLNGYIFIIQIRIIGRSFDAKFPPGVAHKDALRNCAIGRVQNVVGDGQIFGWRGIRMGQNAMDLDHVRMRHIWAAIKAGRAMRRMDIVVRDRHILAIGNADRILNEMRDFIAGDGKGGGRVRLVCVTNTDPVHYSCGEAGCIIRVSSNNVAGNCAAAGSVIKNCR